MKKKKEFNVSTRRIRNLLVGVCVCGTAPGVLRSPQVPVTINIAVFIFRHPPPSQVLKTSKIPEEKFWYTRFFLFFFYVYYRHLQVQKRIVFSKTFAKNPHTHTHLTFTGRTGNYICHYVIFD